MNDIMLHTFTLLLRIYSWREFVHDQRRRGIHGSNRRRRFGCGGLVQHFYKHCARYRADSVKMDVRKIGRLGFEIEMEPPFRIQCHG